MSFETWSRLPAVIHHRLDGRGPRALLLAVVGGATLLWTLAAAAESAIVLPFPLSFGHFPAATYDESGDRIGGAVLSIRRISEERVRLTVETGQDGGANTKAEAEMAILEGDRGLRLLREQSLAHGADGQPMDLLLIDHVAGHGSCTKDGGAGERRAVALPDEDRVVNVPLNLLFLPLVQGTTERVEFQFFLCGGGARLMDFRAKLAGEPRGTGSGSGQHRIIEVTYGPDLGEMVSTFAQVLLPNLSFWFEADDRGTYLAHRMPLFSQGPEVMVVRDGLSLDAFVDHSGWSFLD